MLKFSQYSVIKSRFFEISINKFLKRKIKRTNRGTNSIPIFSTHTSKDDGWVKYCNGTWKRNCYENYDFLIADVILSVTLFKIKFP